MAYKDILSSLLLVGIFSWTVDTQATYNIHASGCNDQKLELTCPQYHKIAIKRIFYGTKYISCASRLPAYKNVNASATNRSRYNVNMTSAQCCQNTHVSDCLMDAETMYSTLNTKCSGYQSCVLEVQKAQTKDKCRFVKSYTDFMTIVYDCIDAGDIVNFCTDDTKRGRSLYLSNKEYPSAIKPQAERTDCQCIIRTHHAQGISINTIDILLAYTEGHSIECRRSLKIQDYMAYSKTIQCANGGNYGFKSLYSRPVHNVTLTLSSSPGQGMGFVWLQAKANDADEIVEIFCGQSLQDLLNRIKHQLNALNRDVTKTTVPVENVTLASENYPLDKNGTDASVGASVDNMNSDIAAIIIGIVAAAFVLIAMVIVAMAIHCRRTRRDKLLNKPLELYPAVNSEPLDLSSYCKYDYDDDHVCSINRSPIKMTAMAEETPTSNQLRPNGFTTMSRSQENHIYRDLTPSPPLPAGISTPPPFAQNQPLLSQRTYREVYYPGDLSLRFVKPLINKNRGVNSGAMHDMDIYEPHAHIIQGHSTLPSNKKAVLISTGPKSPLGKRSKSVTFSQPVAMVTPLNAENDETVDLKSECCDESEDPNYDNLSKVPIPDTIDKSDYPLMSDKDDYFTTSDNDIYFGVSQGKPEVITIPRWEKEYREESPVRPMSTFTNSPTSPDELKVFPPPPYDLRFYSDSDDTAYMSDSSSSFWSPSRQTGKPLVMPKPQKAEMWDN
ncbi:uncharacterized protein LOC106057549 [Biomphalaria glabrata]|uniref:Uncharacterized protein LOC106057549 n=1 Tax=Biomphalaria glabrata TaxID=6526 RepID=A0A9W3AM26_BIOGL|nr:uncharacterized protein LOC106057549 [Biomphalaria glabrata]XP_055888291.1 uncharacterized protein LOC106057549 [Biomphalaria glabrata]XP_055888292.1 uncharacterized protein LOC106057549 [Biomphalaria glabrata]